MTTIPIGPLPEHLRPPQRETIADNWNLPSLEGSRAGVLNAVENSPIPDHWKLVIKTEIESLLAKFNHVCVDAHFHGGNGRANLHLSIVPSTVL